MTLNVTAKQYGRLS